MPKPHGIVDVLVPSQSPEHGLSEHADQAVPAVFAGSLVSQPFAGQLRKAKRIVEFAIGEQPGVRCHDRTVKLERQPAVEIEPQGIAVRFTRGFAIASAQKLRC
jgi:hypothetical protein